MPTGSMHEGVVESGKVEGPACLLAVQVLCSLEVCEIPVVIQDFNHVLSPLEHVPPFLQPTYDRQKFLIVDCVITFSQAKAFGHEPNGVPCPVITKLGQYGSSCSCIA